MADRGRTAQKSLLRCAACGAPYVIEVDDRAQNRVRCMDCGEGYDAVVAKPSAGEWTVIGPTGSVFTFGTEDELRSALGTATAAGEITPVHNFPADASRPSSLGIATGRPPPTAASLAPTPMMPPVAALALLASERPRLKLEESDPSLAAHADQDSKPRSEGEIVSASDLIVVDPASKSSAAARLAAAVADDVEPLSGRDVEEVTLPKVRASIPPPVPSKRSSSLDLGRPSKPPPPIPPIPPIPPRPKSSVPARAESVSAPLASSIADEPPKDNTKIVVVVAAVVAVLGGLWYRSNVNDRAAAEAAKPATSSTSSPVTQTSASPVSTDGVGATPAATASAASPSASGSTTPALSGSAPEAKQAATDEGKLPSSMLLERASIASKAGDSARAAVLYDRVLAQEPGNVEALAGLGDVARKRGDLAAAKSRYQQAIANAPSFSPALLGLADTEWDLGDQVSAQSHYREVVERSAFAPDRAKQRAGPPVSTSSPAPSPAPTPSPSPDESSPPSQPGRE